MNRTPLLIVILLALAAMAAPARAQGGDVLIELDQFGVGSVYRPGEMVGVCLKLTALGDSTLDQATEVWVQWEVPNADGDIAEYGRPRTLTKGVPTRLWLYAPLPPDQAIANTVWTVRAFAYRDGRRGRELGGARISPPAVGYVPINESIIGVVGPNQMGLNQYTAVVGAYGPILVAHDVTRVPFNIPPESFPDRWEGLSCFEAIAWCTALPQDLPTAQAEALREWIRRGGHLIISLPQDTNPWGLGEPGKTDFDDLMPTAAPRTDEDVPLADLLPVMCKAQAVNRPMRIGIRVFKDLDGTFDAVDNKYEPLITLPDGRVIVIQRLFGNGGRITLIGVDLSSRTRSSLPLSNGTLGGVPQADVFWNRILGRRSDTPTTGEATAIDNADRLARQNSNTPAIGSGKWFRQEINMTGKAGKGLAMALLLFSAYWILAGPGGFALLKQYRRVQHAWVVFAAAAGIFTAIAWGGVNLLRSNDVNVKHVTFLDHIARPGGGWGDQDPQLQKAVAWLSVYMPGYADTSIGIESAGALGPVPAQRDLVYSWTPPDVISQRFPDSDRYVVNVGRNTDDFALPARSTATQMKADWLGGVDPAWGGLLRSDPADPIRVEVDRAGNENLTGSILSDLPGDLTDVTLIWIQNKHAPNRYYASEGGGEVAWIPSPMSGQMLNLGRMWRMSGGLSAGGIYQIEETRGAENQLKRNITSRYVSGFLSSNFMSNVSSGNLSSDDWRKRMEMLCIYNQLDPPLYLKEPDSQTQTTMVARRSIGRELDLSPWFNRPCLIVIGFLENSACPIPLRVEGEPVDSSGTTVIRWIYPLELNEEIAFPSSE